MIRSPGIKNLFIMLIIIFIIIWLISGLFFFDRWNRLAHITGIRNELSDTRINFAEYNNILNSLSHDYFTGDVNGNAEQREQLPVDLLSSLDLIEKDDLFLNDPVFIRQIRTCRENINEIKTLLDEYRSLILQIESSSLDSVQLERTVRKIGSPGKGGILGELYLNTSLVSSLLSKSDADVTKIQLHYTKALRPGLIIWLILSGAGLCLLLFYIGSSLSFSFQEIKVNTGKLKKGEIPDEMPLLKTDHTGEIKANLNRLISHTREKISFADKMAEGSYNKKFSPAGKNDVLGNSLVKLNEKLRNTEEEENKRKEEDKRRNWISEGLANFGDIFRSEREDVRELSYKVIFNLVKYLNAAAGSIYLATEDQESTAYEMVASFAFDRRKYMQKKIRTGEGLVGTCALEKETIFLTEIPDNYIEISSGLGESKPVCLLIVPLKLENLIFGVIEIASMKVLEPFEVQFVEQLSEIIASTLASVKINERTSRLLEQSRKQTEEMKQQEEKMRRNMEELQRAQEESQRKETEISGILNTVNASSLLSEFTVNGRFSDVNEKFQVLFESTRDQIIGKHHSDFAVTDKYSDEYKQFWKDLRDGKTIQKTEKYRLFSGVEIWLEETFSAIMDKDGQTVKIMAIAHDITQTKNQQEALVKQANEIVRRSMEMESLSKAVDNSMIQCEIQPDGIISAVNDNFVTVTGYSKRELLGKNNRLFLKDIEKEQFEKIWAEVLKDKTYSGAIRRSKPTGEEMWLMATYSPVKDEQGNIYKIYFLAQDITEKRLKYQLLEEANKEIERLNQLIIRPETQ